VFDIELAETDPEKARAALKQMCGVLLANLVIEDYAVELT
jgi:phosphoribosylformylglycinamidine synthase